MLLSCIDHVAVTVADVEATHRFFDRLFGSRIMRDYAPNGRSAVRVVVIGGGVRLSLHQAGNGVELVAEYPTPGAVDICFRWSGTILEAMTLLAGHDIAIVDGPSPRETADGRASQSVYFRDPDGNLVELMAAD